MDISPGMIEQARGKGVYDRLAVAELSEFLAAEAGAQHHLVLAADVFVYCGDLAPIAAGGGAACWRRAGCSPSRSRAMTAPGVALQPTLRYAHGAAHVRAAIESGALAACAISRAVSTRKEKGRVGAGPGRGRLGSAIIQRLGHGP